MLKNKGEKYFKQIAKPTISKRANDLVYSKFVKEYASVLEQLNIDKDSQLQLKQVSVIMSKLKFLNESKSVEQINAMIEDIWILLGGEIQGNVNEESIFKF